MITVFIILLSFCYLISWFYENFVIPVKKTPLKRKTRLKPMSEKMKVKSKEYSSLRLEYLFDHIDCEICNFLSATQIHHKELRGKNHNNVETFLAVCNHCHQRIHENPKWARENGYLK